jgi:hypothetical protein
MLLLLADLDLPDRAAHPVHPPLWVRVRCVGPPRRPSTSLFRLFIHDLGKNLNTRASIQEKFRRGRHHRP